jgi:asparagine synthetase B (glutamine-hydrolysing)
MCGIFFSVSTLGFVAPDHETLEKLQARGPDSYQSHQITLHSQSSVPAPNQPDYQPCFLTFVATVLALRGSQVQRQPMIDEQTQSIFCWNGEAWKFDGKILSGNDTKHVFQLLLAAAKSSTADSCKKIVALLTRISGPFSFVFYDGISCCVYYSRDPLGRRSLMRSPFSDKTLVLSSVSSSTHGATSEVETDGIYRVSLRKSRTFLPELLQWDGMAAPIDRGLPSNPSGPLPIAASTVNDVKQELSASLHLRVANIPVHTPSYTLSETDETVARFAILFSGGLDCTLLARLAHDLLPVEESIDLLNVAFYNPRTVAANQSQAENPYESCPDRITGRSSFAELRRTCLGRHWRFVAIDIPFSEVIEYRPLILQLMYPQNTEMDLSIALALFFAARGRGSVERPFTSPSSPGPKQAELYQTPARVLLSGLGADELFAGYTRHSNAFTRHGYGGLIDELELDFQRIGKRNLGRDDRVTSHWGKEVRYPYLDEDFVRYALGLKVWQKCGFRESSSEEVAHDVEPAKKVLRLLALELGLQGVAREKKRAIQFGARTAKMEIGKGRRKGTDFVE